MLILARMYCVPVSDRLGPNDVPEAEGHQHNRVHGDLLGVPSIWRPKKAQPQPHPQPPTPTPLPKWHARRLIKRANKSLAHRMPNRDICTVISVRSARTDIKVLTEWLPLSGLRAAKPFLSTSALKPCCEICFTSGTLLPSIGWKLPLCLRPMSSFTAIDASFQATCEIWPGRTRRTSRVLRLRREMALLIGVSRVLLDRASPGTGLPHCAT